MVSLAHPQSPQRELQELLLPFQHSRTRTSSCDLDQLGALGPAAGDTQALLFGLNPVELHLPRAVLRDPAAEGSGGWNVHPLPSWLDVLAAVTRGIGKIVS